MGPKFKLYWIREDGRGDFDMGTYETREDAEAGIADAKAELLDQCGEDFQRKQIEDGRWEVQEISE